jgi:hypothetical protein
VANVSSLTCLSQFDVGKRSDGKTEVLKIRKTFDLPSRRLVLVGFFYSAPENMANESVQMLIHSKRIHQLFVEEGNKAVGGTPSLKEMNKIVRYGECFFVTAMQGQVQQDHVLSLVQFKRWDKMYIHQFFWYTARYFFQNWIWQQDNLHEQRRNLSRYGFGASDVALSPTIPLLPG